MIRIARARVVAGARPLRTGWTCGVRNKRAVADIDEDSGRPRYSVIVAAYNAAAFVRATLDSVRTQHDRRWECIVVDDGSADDTSSIVETFCAEDRRIRLIRQLNAGQSVARNTGFLHRNPESTYSWFLDHDDLLDPRALGEMGAFLDRFPAAGAATCGFTRIDIAGRVLGPGHRSRWVPGRILPRKMSESEEVTPFIAFFCETGQGPFTLFRNSVLARTDLYDARIRPAHEDTDLMCQVSLISEVRHNPARLYSKREHAGNTLFSEANALMPGGAVFRQKWDHRRDIPNAAMLARACIYYYRCHKPLRDLKIAGRALRLFLETRRLGLLRWSGQLAATAVRGFLGFTGPGRRPSE
jgi:glycosyltransferase involved in cell wall biosynthesis